ncbi:hypothetical protein AB4Z10_11025 [Bosea sp. RAF48]|uniref:hypothetical protein n=1 Tax=Bosea sp. RAF48 TaxID=3237480 RepID=UPI003F8E82D3
MTASQGKFVRFELHALDPSSALTFYEKVLEPSGPNNLRELLPQNAFKVRYVHAERPENAGRIAGTTWIGYIEVGNLDDCCAKVVQIGGKLKAGPFQTAGGRAAIIEDNFSAVFGVLERENSRSDDSEQAKIVAWHELVTRDFKESFKLYSDIFGWTRGDELDLGDIGKILLIICGGDTIGAFASCANSSVKSYWNYYLNCSDIQSSAKAIEVNGGAILRGPISVPGNQVAVEAVDPFGGPFGLLA